LSVAQGGTGVTVSSGVNSVVLRDASENISTNAAFTGFTNIAAGASIILTTSSTPNYAVTGSGGQTFQLPSALTLPVGAAFTFNNNQSSGAIAVNNNSATLVVSVPSGGYVTVTLLTKSFAAGTWDVHYSAPANVSWSTNTFNVPASITGATWNSTAVGLLYGGTGATTAAGARTNLGLGGAAVLEVGTTAGTVAAGDDSRLVANGAVASTSGDPGVTVQFITSGARQILMRWRDSVAAAASGVANAWAGLEVAIGIKAPAVNATQSLTVNTETMTGGNDGLTALRITDRAGWIIARLWLSGLWEVPSLLVRGAATFNGAAGLAVQKLSVGAEAVLSTARALSLVTVEDPAGRIVMRLLKTGRLEVPSVKATGIVVAKGFYLREPIIPTQVGISADAISVLNANLPTMPTGLPPSPTFSTDVATYGAARRYASESMGIAVTGERIWAAFYGQNLAPGTAEQDGSYVVLAYCDNYPAGPWTECLYALPTPYTGSGGAGVGINIDPVLYTTPDGRLLLMWKAVGISNVADTVVTNTAVMAMLIQNPQATAGSFIVGRLNYLGTGRPEAPGVLGNDVYMLNDSGGTITWGRLTASGADTITYTALNTLPAFPSAAGTGLECSWAPLSGGRVMALFRTASDGLYTMTSTPGVAGWNTAVKWTAWANNSGGTPAGTRACITRTPSGRLAIGFNWHGSQRYNMSITLSEDGGTTWPYIAKVDTLRGAGAYPAFACDNAGRILMAEDYKRAQSDQELIVWRVDEQSIIAGSPLIEKSLVSLGTA
jgi:hypothetical protein